MKWNGTECIPAEKLDLTMCAPGSTTALIEKLCPMATKKRQIYELLEKRKALRNRKLCSIKFMLHGEYQWALAIRSEIGLFFCL